MAIKKQRMVIGYNTLHSPKKEDRFFLHIDGRREMKCAPYSSPLPGRMDLLLSNSAPQKFCPSIISSREISMQEHDDAYAKLSSTRLGSPSTGSLPRALPRAAAVRLYLDYNIATSFLRHPGYSISSLSSPASNLEIQLSPAKCFKALLVTGARGRQNASQLRLTRLCSVYFTASRHGPRLQVSGNFS
jgi:hypothetical protein